MSDTMRKGVMILVVLFLIYFVVSAPKLAGNTVDGLADFLTSAFDSLIRFLRALGD